MNSHFESAKEPLIFDSCLTDMTILHSLLQSYRKRVHAVTVW